MYYCFNVITRSEKEPEAVLIRALEPLQGISEMKENRKKDKLIDLCSGPGKLCQAFKIDKTLNGCPLTRFSGTQSSFTDSFLQDQGNHEEIFIAPGEEVIKDIEVDRRVGLSPHADAAYWPLRFFVKDNPFVSVKSCL